MDQVFFSICIPAFKHEKNIRRLLNSIEVQSFRDYEIIISDDSPDNSVQSVVSAFTSLPIKYYRNIPSQGMPRNWNFAISKACGQWIKIMHDDDWFSDKDSLKYFAEETTKGGMFIFSRYMDVFENGKVTKPSFSSYLEKRILRNPVSLMAKNVIGPPSVTLIHNSIKEQYDERFKWRVDIDYYIRLLLNRNSFSIIDRPLINVGISAAQVTNSCYNVPEVELPESLLIIEKYGLLPFRDILVYDAWWRMLRNMNIRSKEKISMYASGQVPTIILTMIKHESFIPIKILNIGVVSKILMFISYLLNKKLIKIDV